MAWRTGEEGVPAILGSAHKVRLKDQLVGGEVFVVSEFKVVGVGKEPLVGAT